MLTKTRICPKCEQRLHEAAAAMRRHSTEMETAIYLARTIEPTEEQRQEFAVRLEKSFSDAQSAWDAYRDHLTKHGLLPLKTSRPKTTSEL